MLPRKVSSVMLQNVVNEPLKKTESPLTAIVKSSTLISGFAYTKHAQLDLDGDLDAHKLFDTETVHS